MKKRSNKSEEILRLTNLVAHYETRASDLERCIERLRQDLKDEQEVTYTYFGDLITAGRETEQAKTEAEQAKKRVAELESSLQDEETANAQFIAVLAEQVERAHARTREAVLAEQQMHKLLLEAHNKLFYQERELRELRKKANG